MTPGLTPAAVAGTGTFLGGRLGTLMRRLWSGDWFWSVGVQALTSGMGLILSVVAARLLGVSGFGAYVLIQAGTALLDTLQYQVIGGPLAVASGHRTRSAAYFGVVARAALQVAATVGLAVALYAGIVVEVEGMGGVALPLTAALYGAGHIAHDTAKRLAFATNRPRLAFACECGRHLLFVAGLVAVWLARDIDTPALLACNGLAALAAALPVYAGVLRVRPRAGLHRAVRSHHWLQGRWLLLVVFVSAAHEQFATILAGSWLGEDAAAGLRSAQILLGPLLVLMKSIEYIVPRRAAQHLRAGGPTALSGYLLRILVVLELPVLALCAGIAVYGADILRLLLGKGFVGFSAVATIIAIGPPLTIAREFAVIYLRATRRTAGIFPAFAMSAGVTLLAAYPLIAGHGVLGAAWVVILGHAVSTAAVAVFAVRAARQAPP